MLEATYHESFEITWCVLVYKREPHLARKVSCLLTFPMETVSRVQVAIAAISQNNELG